MTGVFYVPFGNMGVERTPNESAHKVKSGETLEKNILPPLLPGFELATFGSRVLRSTNKLFRLPQALSLSLSLSYVRQEQSTLTLKYFLKNCVCTTYRFRLFDFLHANLCVQFFVFNSHLWRAHSQITNFEKFNYTPSFTRYSTCIRLMSTQIRQTIYRQACAQQSDCLKKHRLSGCLISKRAPVLSKLSSGNSRTSS